MLFVALTLNILETSRQHADPSILGDRTLLKRREIEECWLEWYALEPSIIREKSSLKRTAATKREYVQRLDLEIQRRSAARSHDNAS